MFVAIFVYGKSSTNRRVNLIINFGSIIFTDRFCYIFFDFSLKIIHCLSLSCSLSL